MQSKSLLLFHGLSRIEDSFRIIKGDLEGRPGEEYNSYSFWDYDHNRSDYGVEPIQDVFARCSEFLDYIKEKHSEKDILIVTHSAPYRALKHLLLGHDLKGNLLNQYGSVGEASREIGVTKTTILNQCNHNVKTKPRCGYYFRYLSEYESKGFVL